MYSCASYNISKESKHSNTSVLDLYVTKTIKLSLGSIVKKSKWIIESKWWLYSKLSIESVKSGGSLSNLGWSESRCSCDKRSKDSGLHFVCCIYVELCGVDGKGEEFYFQNLVLASMCLFHFGFFFNKLTRHF